MAKVFPLEAVLRLRRMEEEAKMKEFAAFERVLVRESRNLESLQECLYQKRMEMDERTATQGLSSQEGQLYLSFFSAQSSRIRYQEDLVRKIRVEVERKRKEMNFAICRRKIFDKLKEKHAEATEYEMRRLETNEIDEIAGIRYVATMKGEAANEAI